MENCLYCFNLIVWLERNVRIFEGKAKISEVFGILFISLLPFEPLVLQMLRAYSFILFNLIG